MEEIFLDPLVQSDNIFAKTNMSEHQNGPRGAEQPASVIVAKTSFINLPLAAVLIAGKLM